MQLERLQSRNEGGKYPALATDEAAGSEFSMASHVLVTMLRAGERIRVTSRGGSMWPTIRPGATLEIQPIRPDAVRIGRVYAFRTRGDRVVTHRLVAIHGERLTFWGDARREPDPFVCSADVLGEVRIVQQGRLCWRVPRRTDLDRIALGARALLRAMQRWRAST